MEDTSTGLTETSANAAAAPLPAVERFKWLPDLVALLLICALEIVCFAPIVNKVGFYLDDWITLKLLGFGSHSFFAACSQYLVSDPRVVARPVEAFYYVTLYFLFGLKPLGWHLVNMGFEIGAAFFLYLAVSRLTDSRALSAVAALILVIYPNHDVTHYWATCSSETLSLFLVMASLFCTVLAVKKRQGIYHLCSALLIAISLFNYETFLPLIVLNAAFAFLALGKKPDLRTVLKQMALVVAPFVAAVLSLLLYSRLIAPRLAVAQVHPVSFNLQHMLAVIWQGVNINSPIYSVSFFGKLASEAFLYEPPKTLITTEIITCVVIGFAIWWLAKTDRPSEFPSFWLLPIGAVAFVASYSIFGLNPEYMPTLETILSRINEGSAVAIALMVSGTVAGILHLRQRHPVAQSAKPTVPTRAQATLALTTLSCLFLLPIVSLSLLANRGYARAWELCWYTETVIRDSLRKHSDRFKDGDSVILANCPRYVLWSPLFDGIWDFQPMLQLTLKNQAIKGGVVSERMVIEGNTVKDISKGTVCNVYDFGKSYLIFPPQGDIEPVDSPSTFIKLIETRGMKFGLDKAALSQWKEQAALGKH